MKYKNQELNRIETMSSRGDILRGQFEKKEIEEEFIFLNKEIQKRDKKMKELLELMQRERLNFKIFRDQLANKELEEQDKVRFLERQES